MANIAVVTVSGGALDWLVGERLVDAGHRVVARAVVEGAEAPLRAQLVSWISDPAIDVVIAIGGIGDNLAPRALAPLVTERLVRADESLWRLAYEDSGSAAMPIGAQAARCGSTLVFLLPQGAGAVAKALEQAVIPELGERAPARVPYITTGSIAVVGDLPALPAVEAPIDLRASGRRGLWILGAMAATAAAGVGVVGMDVIRRNDALTTSHHAAAQLDAATPAVAAPVIETAPPSPPQPRPVSAPAAKPRMPAPVTKSPRARPAPAPAPVELSEPTTPQLEDACDEVTCAMHGNERECCAPYRTLGASKLDQAMIAVAIENVKQKIIDCGASTGIDGLVEIGLQVDRQGRVTSAVVEQAPESSLGQCVVAVLRTASFPRTSDGGSFVYRYDVPAAK